MQDVQLGSEDGAFDTEEKPVVRVLRVVNAVLIRDERPEHAAEFDHPVPIAVAAGQARDFGDENDADLAETDGGDQALEADPLMTAAAGQAEILIDDDHFLKPQLPGAVLQRILTTAAF